MKRNGRSLFFVPSCSYCCHIYISKDSNAIGNNKHHFMMAVVLCFDDAYGQPRQETVVVAAAVDKVGKDEYNEQQRHQQAGQGQEGSVIVSRSASSCSIVDATEHILRQQQQQHQSSPPEPSSNNLLQLSHHQSQSQNQQPLPRRRRLLVREFSVSDSHLQEEDVKSLVEVLLSSSSTAAASSSTNHNHNTNTTSTTNHPIKPLASEHKMPKKKIVSSTETIIPNINRKKSLSRKSSSTCSLSEKIQAIKEESSSLSSSAAAVPQSVLLQQSSPSCSTPEEEESESSSAVLLCCALERLTLTNNGLTCTSSTSLARIVMYTSQTLQELDLSNNQVKAPGLEILVRALCFSSTSRDTSSSSTSTSNNTNTHQHHCALQKLNLFNNRLGSLAAKPIAHLLRNNSSIVDLRLGKNSLKSHKCIATIAAALLENATLQHLDLSFNQISNANAKLLAQVLDQSTSSSISHEDSDAFNNSIMNKSRLKSLELQHNGITDTGALELAGAMVHGGPNKTLHTLDLSTNNLSLSGARAMAYVVKYSHTLQELILSACNMGDAGLHLLCAGWKEQENGSVLLHLDVSWNLIHNSGCMELAATMLDGPDAILTRLNLASNGIGDAGACGIAQALVSRGSTRSLRELNLIGNQIGDVGAAALANAIASPHCPELYQLLPTMLQWQENKRMTETGKTRIQRALLFRHVHYETWLKRDVLSRIEHHCREEGRRLNLQLFAKRNVVGDDELFCICHAIAKYQRQISFLSLQGPQMTQRSIQALCEQVVGGVTATTEADERLHGKNTVDHHHGDVDSITKGACVERLYMQAVPGFGDVGASLVAQAIMKPSCGLIVLSLVDCNISCLGATQLARAFKSLGKSSPLDRVNLKGNNIGDAGAVELLKAVHFLPMQRPSVVDNGDGQGGGGGVLVQEPSSNVACNNITALNLACNNIPDASLLCPTVAAATKATLNPHTSAACPLEELDISGNVITDRGALDLAKICMDLDRLRWLTVSGNRMTKRGVQVLSLYLPLVCSLVADGQQQQQSQENKTLAT
jgi:Ran GTPase-activating protein (RanGAP) involved in mRNA processing and transport